MQHNEWSETDLVNKWGRSLTDHRSHGLPWLVLGSFVSNLSDDTVLPRDILLECIRTRNVAGLMAVADSLDVTAYTSADLLLQDRLVVELFSKFDFPNSPFNKREKAKLRFFEAEERCREANFRVGRALGLDSTLNSVIHDAIRIIERVLGGFSVTEMLSYSRFGPGSTLCIRGALTTEYFKLKCRRPTVSQRALPYAEALLRHDHKWRGYLLGIHPYDIAGDFSPLGDLSSVLKIRDHNKVAFVPKNAKTDRSTATEPYFNVYFQLGIGGMIRKRLYRHCGINLDSQERNQSLALVGSLDGSVATVDFSMASDTIAQETVRLLIPDEWFQHLDRLRSKYYVMDGGKPRYWYKFSSMGNGYTFELETLIFYAIALASTRHVQGDESLVSVFGDDVALPTEAYDTFEKVSVYLGFKVNEEKSFVKGLFRESCGEDFLKGTRVRPVFCKELRTVQHCVSLSNRLLALNRAVGAGSRIDSLCRGASDLLLACVPRDVRRLVVGPPSEDVDGYIHREDVSEISESPLVRWNRDLFCWEHPTIRFRARELEPFSVRALALFSHWGTAVRRKPIPDRKTVIIDGLRKLAGCYHHAEIGSFIRETTPREITGREIGGLALGTSLVWSLG